ncbi:hypothetical protein JCM9279_006442 [Rhodotorula babjevae]
MDTYASLSLDTVNFFSTANTRVFPALCNPHGITDVDAYCATKTSEVCCGLCPNQSVSGPGQFVWAIVSYAIASFVYTLAPSEVWGMAVLQIVNAQAFIGVGVARVAMGATEGGMTRWHSQFLAPQTLGFIYIMAPAILAPNWSRVGLSQKDMERRVRSKANVSHVAARRSDVRAVEAALYKKHHDRWSYPIFAFWVLNMSAWTGLYVWLSLGPIEYSQANCEDDPILDILLTPTAVTIILGTLAWLLVFFDGFLVLRKEKQGGADFIIDTFLSKGKDRTMKEHRRLERRITIGTTLALFLLWLFLNCWLWIEAFQKFALSGGDWFTFGQVEQLTALFPDLLALAAGVSSYLGTRDDLRLSRTEVDKFVQRASRQVAPHGEVPDDAHGPQRRSRLRAGRAADAAGLTADDRHHHDRTSSDDPHDPLHHEPRLPGASFLDDTHRRARHRNDDAEEVAAEPTRRSSIDDTLTALPPMSSRPVDPPARRRGLARVLHPRSSQAQPQRSDRARNAEGERDDNGERDIVHHAPHALLPEQHLPRASFTSLREAYDLPQTSHSHGYEPQHGRATAHDEHHAQESLSKRHASRGRRPTRGRGRLADVEEDEGRPLREDSDEREW